MTHVYPVIFTPEDEGGYCVYAPDLSGCVTSADSIAEGMEKIRDGIAGMLYILERDGKPLPEPSWIKALTLEPEDTASLVDVNLDAYRQRQNTKAVKRTISIPGWLDEMASKEGLSLSQVTQEALRNRLSV